MQDAHVRGLSKTRMYQAGGVTGDLIRLPRAMTLRPHAERDSS